MVAELASVAPDGSGQQVGYIPLAKIRGLDERQQVRNDWRHDDGQQKLDELTQSIREHGLLTPVELEPCADGTYVVLIGHRRIVAARRASLSHVPAVVRHASEQERIMHQLVENIHRQDISAVDKGRAFVGIMERREWSMGALARRLGITANTVERFVGLLRDGEIADAVTRGVIASTSAQELRSLVAPYDSDVRAKLRNGERVTKEDVREARRRAQGAGVVSPQSVAAKREASADARERALVLHRAGVPVKDIAAQIGESWENVARWLNQMGQRPILVRDESCRNAEAEATREHVQELQRQGLTPRQIAQQLGRSLQCVRTYLVRNVYSEANQAEDQPRVTFNGVSLDPIIARAQERAEQETQAQAPQVPEPAPHPRPLRSPLPWENHDESPVRYGVDPAGLVHPEPQPQHEAPPQSAAPAAVAAQPPAPLQCVSAPPPVVDDPDVTRVRFMLHGAQQPCRDLLGTMLNLGREKGWSCHELWHKLDQASRAR